MRQVVLHSVLTLAPTVLFVCSIFLGPMSEWLDEVAYIHPLGALFRMALLSLLPFCIQLLVRSCVCIREGRSASGEKEDASGSADAWPLHPFGVLVPIGLVVAFLPLPLGERLGAEVPQLSEVTCYDQIVTDREGTYTDNASLVLIARGWGNHRHFEIQQVAIRYSGKAPHSEIRVDLQTWEVYRIARSEQREPVTENYLRDHAAWVTGSSAEAVETYGSSMWAFLQSYATGEGLPSPTYRGASPSRFVYEAGRLGVCVGVLTVSMPVLVLLSWLLSRRYVRKRRGMLRHRPPPPTEQEQHTNKGDSAR